MGTNLDGHVAVVTGSAMGMGKVTAKELASRGAAVACWDIVGDKAMETARWDTPPQTQPQDIQ
ncbi:MAG: hypothetical protein QF704_15060 [Anaerolineales bacterium]|nr:hypothetical protein [Anaerolineales bacterium]